jgi:hypothetical protein
MKLSRISLLVLLLFLLVPSVASAQSAAEKSWKPFWTRFSSAVKSRDKVAVKRLMSSEKDFFSGGGGDTRDQWLQMLDDSKLWGEVQRSTAKGVVAANVAGRIERITKDRNLIFQYIGGRWRFVGIMGD